MITTKQRAYLRGLANDMPALYQLGKNGLTDEFVKTLDEALNARELIKITVLKNAFLTSKEAMQMICEALSCEAVSAVGSKVVVYRRAKDESKVKIEL